MGPKYEFTDEILNHKGFTLHRIRRLSDGKIGGWIEKEENLSQEGNCWVDNDAMVYDNAIVSENARIENYAEVYDNAKISNNARIINHALIYGSAHIYENAMILGDSKIYQNAKVYGNANIHGKVRIYGDAEIYDNADISQNSIVCGNIKIYNNARIWGKTIISDEAQIFGKANIFDDARVIQHAKVYGNAKVYGQASISDYAQIYDMAEISGQACIYDNAKIFGYAQVYHIGKVYGDAEVYGNTCIYNSEISSNEDFLNKRRNDAKNKIKDFIYKVNESNKLTIGTSYDSIDDFFEDDSVDSYRSHEAIVVLTADTKMPIIVLEKAEVNDKKVYKFIVDITNEDGDTFNLKSTIYSKEKFNQLLQSTLDALKQDPQFSKYVEELENVK